MCCKLLGINIYYYVCSDAVDCEAHVSCLKKINIIRNSILTNTIVQTRPSSYLKLTCVLIFRQFECISVLDNIVYRDVIYILVSKEEARKNFDHFIIRCEWFTRKITILLKKSISS